MSRRIVLIRHGMPRIEEGVPAADWQLSPEGAVAAADLAAHLRGFDFDAIASSPEPKAAGTAQAIAARLGLAVEIDPGLAEHARRSVGFLPRPEIEAGIARLLARPHYKVFGDETGDECYERFAAALARQADKGAGDVAMVTHGTILTVYLDRMGRLTDAFAFWRALKTPAAVILAGAKMQVLP